MSAPLPQGYLAKKGGQWRPVRLLDIAVLLYAVYQGAADEDVGFEDAQETLDTLTRKLNKKIFMEPAVLESALWSCNLLNEKGKFIHPRGLSFEQFLKDVLGRDKFNRVYNVIEKEGEK